MENELFKNQIDIIFEHQFWLQILGDHMRFIIGTTSSEEADIVQRATLLRDEADSLLETARSGVDVTEDAIPTINKIRELKLDIIRAHLTTGIKIGLPPTFVNHMINELDEYMNILRRYTGQQVVTDVEPLISVESNHLLHHHHLWNADAEGHLDAIMSNLDATEKELRKEARKLKKIFGSYYVKSLEYAGYMRTELLEFNALNKFNDDVKVKIGMFLTILRELRSNRLTADVLGTLQPLMVDHMIREESYFLTKIGDKSFMDIAIGERVEKLEDDVVFRSLGSAVIPQ
ncbi:Protein of unknown function DUF2935 [Orpheovirus IHUMI-LCC2]|uniref:DUF2935 domain-containing protein n=1 Tax=Orpheovirus IHUMI-LCC2 TaxID=2023057 RepID=A0A2I2L551_9VIRU|nr:Protein of unknown function DUF2935 [Orpheovirus IHUMI-LCC2]SNW62641.1 Protein of unknown function DUF2935 [Orpheovirus IHUMI-LCC2]